uniref:hypothetical protein n=1 Tax=Roseivirga sp. TaxID=1964215 RepID=UPI0040472269
MKSKEQSFHDGIFESGARESVRKFYAVNEVNVKHYFLTTLALPLLYKKPPKFLISITNALDRFLLLFSFIRKQSYQVIMELKNPKRN